MQIKKTKKCYFQLLEVMIALFLIAACAIPVMSTYVYIYKEQSTMNQMVDLDHWAHIVHAKITENLYCYGACGESLKPFLNKEMRFLDSEFVELEKKPYEFFYILTIQKPMQVKKQQKATKLLMELELYVKSKQDSKILASYNYNLYLERVYKEGQNELENGIPTLNKKKTE